MKKGCSLAVCLLFLSLTVMAQKKEEQAVTTAVQRLNQAMIDGNQILLDELTSKNLSYGHSSGLVENKDAFITAIVSGASRFTSINLTDQTIAISNSIAIVRHKLAAATDNKGQEPGQINLGVMQIWQKEKGKWVLVARHATKI